MDYRKKILQLSKNFYESKEIEKFTPGKTYIPCTGKIIDQDDLYNLLDSSLDLWLTAGRYTKQFENDLAKKIGLKYSILTVSGSSANLLAFAALTSWKLKKKIEFGSEVITPAASFPTTVAPIIQNNSVPVFVDVDLETGNLLTEQVEEAISENTSAIMAAHTLGNPFDLEKICEIKNQNNLFLIEDTCDAFGSKYKGQNVGTFGDTATLSFYPAHHITMGEGGAVLTNKLNYKILIESFRDWGRDCFCMPGEQNTCGNRFSQKHGDLPYGYDHKFTFSHIGYNLKATDMQAAIGVSQLKKVDKFIQTRKDNFEKLSQEFKKNGLDQYFILPKKTENSDPSWFGFLLTLKENSKIDRRTFVSELEENKIGSRQLFAGNIIKQPGFKNIKYRKIGDLKNTDYIMRQSFWIGVWPGINDERISYIVKTFRKIINKYFIRE